MPFQSAVSLYQAPGIPGDFADANPHASVVAGESQLVAGTGGLTVGGFGWMDSTGTTVLGTGTGVPTGFVHREMQAFITTYLAETSNLVAAGQPITLMSAGTFWVRPTTAATIGQKIFVNPTTGAIQTGAAGATVTNFVETKWVVASACLANEVCKMTTWS